MNKSVFTGQNQFSGLSKDERFWQKVNKKSDDECWEWLGCRHHQWKYGSFNVDGKYIAAHRYSWILHYGNIPTGFIVCHHCDNPPCCNPKHLFLGTDADNNLDKRLKGRQPDVIGEPNPRAILNEMAVKVILFSLKTESHTRKDLARIFGISVGAINSIVSKRNWSWVTI